MKCPLNDAEMNPGGQKRAINGERVLEFALRVVPFGLLRLERSDGIEDVGTVAAPINNGAEHFDCFR